MKSEKEEGSFDNNDLVLETEFYETGKMFFKRNDGSFIEGRFCDI